MSDIEELMERDPLNLTADDLDALIEYFRSTQAKYNLGNMSAGSTKPKTERQKQVSAIAAKIDLSKFKKG